ncbi:SpaA isopeptide-forming pilin-related protein [Clostridium sp. Marseille-P3244]|uniref:SpaA isopeptide-forming pilin-related protein n=1 Tax=Clostridium sp. Marseille-P3244 TaxID=1871020 RepID=UPI0009320252|nr:SpaA isopeptide-forming pilin-related protein [Clostridium sp. Marseille-P3244]
MKRSIYQKITSWIILAAVLATSVDLSAFAADGSSVHAVNGRIFEDANQNGTWDEGEAGIAGVTVKAYSESTGELVTSADTAGDGTYKLVDLADDSYTVRLCAEDGQTAAYDLDTSIAVQEARLAQLGGKLAKPAEGEEGFLCYSELAVAQDMELDLGLLRSVDNSLTVQAGESADASAENSADVSGGEAEEPFSGDSAEGSEEDTNAPSEGSDTATDGEQEAETGEETGSEGEEGSDTETPVYAVNGLVYDDADSDGEKGEDEAGISGIEVTAYKADTAEEVGSAVTDDNGNYRIEGLAAGSYDIELWLDNETLAPYDLAMTMENKEGFTGLYGEDGCYLSYTAVELSEDTSLELGLLRAEEETEEEVLSEDELADSNEAKSSAASSRANYTVAKEVLKVSYGGKSYEVQCNIHMPGGNAIGKGDFHYIYLVGDKGRLFCISPGIPAEKTVTSVNGKMADYNDLKVGNYATTRDQRIKAQRIAYYSGWYTNHDNTSMNNRKQKEYYIAAQILIWQALGCKDIPVSLKGANSATNNEFRSSINAKKQDINTVLAQHGPPEFKGSSYNKKTNTWEIIRSGAEPNKVYSLEDTTKSLQHFTVQSYGNGLQSVDIRKVTNRETGAVSTFLDVRVKANATPGQSYEIKLNRTFPKMTADNRYYKPQDGKQALAEFGQPNAITAIVNVRVETNGTVQIQKKDDAGNPVAGVVFRYGYSANALNYTTAATNASGVVTLTEQTPGQTIYVREQSVPSHIVISNEIKSVKIVKSKTVSLNFKNDRVTRTFTLRKVSATTGKPIADAMFQYRDVRESWYYTAYTDENGEFTSAVAYPAGTDVQIIEQSAGPGFIRPNDGSEQQHLIISANAADNVVRFVNTPIQVNLTIYKRNANTQEPIQGMVFKVGPNLNGTLNDPAGYQLLTTDAQGKITTRNYDARTTIYYQEVSGPGNILVDSTIKRVDFLDSNEVEYVYNEEMPVTIRVIKTGVDDLPLAGVQFDLQQYVNGTWRTQAMGVTNLSGQLAFSTMVSREDIRNGLVRLVETKTVTGYELLKDPIYVSSDNLNVENNIIDVSVENPKIPTEFTVYKYDEDTREPIKGAVFHITDARGNLVLELETNEEGIAKTEELFADTTYYIEEVTPPRGYEIIDTGRKAFRLTEDMNYEARREYPNKPIYGYIEINKVNQNDVPLEGIEFTVYKNNMPVTRLITDENGYAKSNKLLADAEYTVRETYAPAQFNVEFPAHTFDFLDGRSESGDYWSASFNEETLTMSYEIENPEKTGTITLTKVDSEDPSIEVQNAEFILVNRYTGEILDRQVTGIYGTATFNEVPIVNPSVDPRQGYYYLEEVTPGDNHILPENTRKYFSMTVQSLDYSVTFENPPIRGDIVIKKVDEDNPDKVLKDAEFALYKVSDMENPIRTGITDENGILRFEDLRYGSYYVEETKPPKYYYRDLEYGKKGEYVLIDEHEEVIELQITNPKLYVQVEVNKTGFNDVKLPGAKFNIVSSDGKVLDTVITDEDGRAVSKELSAEELGDDAYVVEAEKLINYELNTTKYPISIDSNSTVRVQLVKQDIKNTIEVPKLKLNKVNEAGEGVAATFKVSASTTNGYMKDFTYSTTKEDHIIELDDMLRTVVDDIDAGHYGSLVIFTLQEIETEDQYQLLPGGSNGENLFGYYYIEEGRFEWSRVQEGVSWDNDTLTITAVNKKIPITLNLIKQGTDDKYLSDAVFQITPNRDGVDLEPIEVITDGTAEGVEVSLPYADSYLIEETEAPEGYRGTVSQRIYLDDFQQETTGTEGLIVGYNHTVTFTNEKMPELRIRKIGSDGKPLDATFELQITERSTIIQTINTSAENDGYGEIDSNIFYNYASGDIAITERAVNSNYVGLSQSIEGFYLRTRNAEGEWEVDFQFDPMPDGVQMLTESDGSITFVVTNERRTFDYQIKKKGTGDDYVSAEIAVDAICKDDSGEGIDWAWMMTLDTVSEQELSIFKDNLTDEQGYEIYITEYSTSTGYQILDRFKAFDYYPENEGIEKFQNIDEHISVSLSGDTFEITLENPPIPAEVTLKKVDESTGEPLAGAVFEVTTSNGVTERITTTGSEEGDKVTLPYAASYTVTEIEAPAGYKLLDEPQTFNISSFTEKEDEDGNTYYEKEIILKNTHEFGLYLKKTDEFGNKANAKFSVRATTPSVQYGPMWEIETVDGIADLTPFLEEIIEEYGSNLDWNIYVEEIETEPGLILSSRTLQMVFRSSLLDSSPGYIDIMSGGSEWISSERDPSNMFIATAIYRNENIPINLTVIKRDSESPDKYLAGAVYEITPEGKNPITVETTADASGTTVKLPFADTYIVREITAPEGYILDPTVYVYSRDDFGSMTNYHMTAEYTNDPIKGQIEITKYDANDSTTDKAKLQGAVFEIYEGTVPESGTEDEKYDEVSTDNGYVLADTVTIGEDGTGISKEIPYGQYILKEITAPENYQLSKELIQTEVRREGETVYVNIPNDPMEGTLRIFKYEEGTDPKAPLAGAVFTIHRADTDEQIGDQYTTGPDGYIGPVSLPYGEYYVKEVSFPAGYITSKGATHPFTLNGENTEAVLEIANEKAEYSFRLHKINGDTGDRLAGARFGLFADGESPYDIQNPAEPILEFETNTNGVATVMLENPGDFDIYELQAPEGYVKLIEKVADIHVDEEERTAEVTVENFSQKMTIRIEKSDEQSGEPLPGAVFEIYNRETGELVATTGETGADGTVTVEVPARNVEYTVREIKAPDGYILNDAVYNVMVNREGDAEGNVIYTAESVYVTNRQITSGSIRVIKVDADNPEKRLEGAVFEVYDESGDKVADLVTNSQGEAMTGNLPMGTYTVRETQAPEGYDLSDTTEYTAQLLASGQVVEITVEDPQKTGGFTIRKVDVQDDSKVLEGAEFTVYGTYDDAWDMTDPIQADVITGEDGIAEFSGLPYGTYYVRETKAPENYELSNEIIEVEVNADSAAAPSITYVDYPLPTTASFRVVKRDLDTRETLEGAVFRVTGGPDGTYSREYTTGAGGSFMTEELAFGTYQVEEIQAPEGYKLSNPTVQTVVLDQEDAEETLTVEFDNPQISTSIRIVKTDNNAEDPKPLVGAVFDIYSLDEDGNRGETAVDRLVTDVNGEAVSRRLPQGRYEIVEVMAPFGYVLVSGSTTDNFITIDQDSPEVIDRTFTNEPVTGSLEIHKTDLDTGEPLEGVEFTIYHSDWSVYKTIVTGEDGIASLEDVPYGMYLVRETAVPDGYAVDDAYSDVFNIGSEETQRNVVLEVTNEKVKGTFSLVKVDSTDNTIGVAGARYGIYTALIETTQGVVDVDPESYLGSEYDLVTMADTILPDEEDPDTGEITGGGRRHNPVESAELPLGTYYVKELASPVDYKLNDTVYIVSLTEEDPFIEVTAEDEPLTGTVSVRKEDAQGQPLPGAVFAVYTEDQYEKVLAEEELPEEPPVIYIESDETGIASTSELKLDENYVLVEYRAPGGYEADESHVERFTPTLEEQTFEFTYVNHKKSEIVIYKVDEAGEPQQGVTFGLYKLGDDGRAETADDEFVAFFGTSIEESGVARYETDDLANGWYFVKEEVGPAGHDMTDRVEIFEITDDRREFEFTYVNPRSKGALEIRKTDEDGRPLAGAEFELYIAGDSWFDESITENTDEFVQTVKLDENGYALVEDLLLYTYVLKETVVPDGYMKADDILVDLGEGTIEDGRWVYEVTVPNELIKGQIQIQKAAENTTGIETGIDLSGAEFEIADQDGTVVDTLVTDADGQALSKELPEGTYTITETKAPEGTVLNSQPGQVIIDGSKEDRIYTYTHQNPLVTGRINIVKVDQDGAKLGGAEFDILKKDGTVVDHVVSDNNLEYISRPLPYGEYIIRETKTPDGHNMESPGQMYECEIREADQTVEIQITNPEDGGHGLYVVKYDKDDVQQYLPGAVFQISSAADPESVLGTYESGPDGILEVTDLEAGDYILTEIQPPPGYQLDPTPYPFTLGETSYVTLYIANEQEKGRIRFEKTGEMPSELRDDTSYPELKEIVWSQQELEGAEIGIYATEEIVLEGKIYQPGELVTTVKSGETSIYLPAGDYQYRELSAPGSYILDPQMYDITVEPEEIAEAEPTVAQMENPHAGVDLEIYKTLENCTDPEKYREVKFGLFNNRAITAGSVEIEEDTLLAVIGIDETGKGTCTDLKLPEGAYYLLELEAPDDYMISEESQEFTVSYENGDTSIQIGSPEEPIVNEQVYGTIRIEKTGDIFNTVSWRTEGSYEICEPVYETGDLEGAEFTIYAAAETVIDGVTYQAGDAVDTVVTSTAGSDENESRHLPFGTYIVKETKAPDGYILDDTEYEVTLEQPAEPHTITAEEIYPYNRKASVELTVYKQFFGSEDADLYESVLFGVYADEEIRGASGGAVLAKDTLIQLIEIGADGSGSIEQKLPPGHYYIKELETAQGYEVDETKYSFTVEGNATGAVEIEGISEQQPVVNYPEGTRTPFAFRKVNDLKQPLDGAVFRLYMCSQDHEHSDLAGESGSCWMEAEGLSPQTSGEDGIVNFGQLPDGDYQLQETEAPSGYELPAGQWRIHIDSSSPEPITITAQGTETPPAFAKVDGQETYQYQLANHRKSELPILGGAGIVPYIGGGGILLFVAGLFRRKKKKGGDVETG